MGKLFLNREIGFVDPYFNDVHATRLCMEQYYAANPFRRPPKRFWNDDLMFYPNDDITYKHLLKKVKGLLYNGKK